MHLWIFSRIETNHSGDLLLTTLQTPALTPLSTSYTILRSLRTPRPPPLPISLATSSIARKLMTRFVCLVLLGLSLSVSPALAGTFYVGPCHTGSFATITDAINSSKVAPGSIIKVCPADYSEQLIISKSLTIEGLPDTTAGEELPTVFLPSTYTS